MAKENSVRVIKFRSWQHDGIAGTMVLFDLFERPWPYDPSAPVMQFTGLTDKNGKEIYEGDIVKGVVERPQLLTADTDENCNTNMGGIIYWDYAGFSMKVIEALCDPEREGMANYFDFGMGYEGDFRQMEVIGNIYENPELIGEYPASFKSEAEQETSEQ